jgi:hypothetical protein
MMAELSQTQKSSHLQHSDFLLADFYLKMEVIRSSETSIDIQTTRRYVSEDGYFHDYCSENLKSCMGLEFLV